MKKPEHIRECGNLMVGTDWKCRGFGMWGLRDLRLKRPNWIYVCDECQVAIGDYNQNQLATHHYWRIFNA